MPRANPASAAPNAIYGRDALVEYVKDPSRFPSSRVITHDADFVTIFDAFPKSSVHLLLLPRDPSKYLQHPVDAFEDATFLASVRDAAARLKSLAASELLRKYSRYSAQDSARNAALDSETSSEVLPAGRDWSKEIIVGVHAHPSMNHLHVHVLSLDRVNECMRHRKHYNSFTTQFLVPLDDFPLAADDVRRNPGRQGYLESDLRCWRCQRGFGHRFKELKAHLEEELDEWKKL